MVFHPRHRSRNAVLPGWALCDSECWRYDGARHPSAQVTCRGCRGSLSTSNRKSEDGACGNGAGARLSRRSIQVTRNAQKRESPSLSRRCDRRERARMATVAVLTHHRKTRRQRSGMPVEEGKPEQIGGGRAPCWRLYGCTCTQLSGALKGEGVRRGVGREREGP